MPTHPGRIITHNHGSQLQTRAATYDTTASSIHQFINHQQLIDRSTRSTVSEHSMASNSAVLSRPSAAAAALLVVVVLALAAGTAPVVRGDFAADRAECADKLMGLATCLTYVQATATARAPTPDCCAGLKQVVTASKKCLCVLVKDRDEPALGFKINVTRAMDLPDTCNFPATFSDCPKILNMSPDSPDAQIFKEYAKKHELRNGTAGTGGAGGKSSSTATTGPTGDAGAGKQPCMVFFFLVSALLAAISILA